MAAEVSSCRRDACCGKLEARYTHVCSGSADVAKTGAWQPEVGVNLSDVNDWVAILTVEKAQACHFANSISSEIE